MYTLPTDFAHHKKRTRASSAMDEIWDYTNLYGPINLGGLNVATCVEGAADFLHNVNKDLIPAPSVCWAGIQHRLNDARGSPGCPLEEAVLPSLHMQTPLLVTRDYIILNFDRILRRTPFVGSAEGEL